MYHRYMATRSGQVALTRDDVVAAALRIAVSEGVEQLTVRRLSAELSVAVTSIYWHVGDKEALLDAVADQVIEHFGHLTVRGADPETRLISAGRNLRRMLLEESELVALVHRQGRTAALMQPAWLRITRELMAAGLHGRDVAMAGLAILNHVVGSVLLDRQVQRQPAQRQTAEELWAHAELPMSQSLRAALTQPPSEEQQFRYSLGLLVKALIGA